MSRRLSRANSIFTSEDVERILAKRRLILDGGSLSEDMPAPSNTTQGYFICWGVQPNSSAHPSQPNAESIAADEESLRLLYAEFADEDRALANEGLEDYERMLTELDGE